MQGMPYVPRSAEKRLKQLLKTFPAVLVYGPRQCGKSTLVRRTLPGWRHLDLERPLDFSLLTADLEGFLDTHPAHVCFDEAQRLPELFSALRYAIDRSAKAGRFVLLGSASPALLSHISESLAGRVGLLELTPFGFHELAAERAREPRWFWGGYPAALRTRTPAARLLWFDAYVTTFLERDLPNLGLALPPQRLRTLWTMLTHVHGSLLNVSDLARSLAVSAPTVQHYLDILEGAFMVRRLPPFFCKYPKTSDAKPESVRPRHRPFAFLGGIAVSV